MLRDGESCAARPVGHGLIDVNGNLVQVLWYLFVPACSHWENGNIRMSVRTNYMRPTFLEEKEHIKKLILGIPGCQPQLTWFYLHAELATAKRKKHAMEMAALEEVVEVEETIIS